MKQSGIEIGQLYQSYAKSKNSPLNSEKFDKLFLKINPNLSKEQLEFCWKKFDNDNDQIVTFKDFENALKIYGE